MAFNSSGVYGGPTELRTFNETGKSLSGIFRSYWETHGGLAQQGLPLTDTVIESDRSTVYLERAVFEHHPEYENTEYEVLLRRVGADAAARAGFSGIGVPQIPEN